MNAINIIKHSDPHTTRVIQANKLSSHKGKQTNKQKNQPQTRNITDIFREVSFKVKFKHTNMK